jgi:hypothetical protein
MLFWAQLHKSNESEADHDALMTAFQDIETSNDRAAAIVAAAFVEDHLSMTLRRRFHQDDKIINDTFRSSGPLGSFAAKINLAFLVGLCSKEACKELNTIRAIRNEFAHNVLTSGFDSQRVRDLAANLTFDSKLKFTITSADEGDERVILDSEVDGIPTTPRERYLKACWALLMLFVFTHHMHSAPPEPPF